ncbi:MAG: hypothetical protein PHU42_03245 [Patescibacteria group bacterium]|nr:hypothetical protein [Patescibacteria group bacterium]
MDRKKLTKALDRLGFIINEVGGKGSHLKVVWPKNQKSITIQKNLPKQVLLYVFKEIEIVSGIKWDDIKKFL